MMFRVENASEFKNDNKYLILCMLYKSEITITIIIIANNCNNMYLFVL